MVRMHLLPSTIQSITTILPAMILIIYSLSLIHGSVATTATAAAPNTHDWRRVSADAHDLLSSIDPPVPPPVTPSSYAGNSSIICSLFQPSPHIPADLTNLPCDQGFRCQMPLQPQFWMNGSFYLTLNGLNQTNYVPPINISQPLDPDNTTLTSLYQAIQLCQYCTFSDDPNAQTYGPCYVLNTTNACANITSQPIVALGVCLPCSGGEYCPGPGTNTTSPIAYAFDNLCEAGSYCPSFGEQYDCPVGYFCPRGSRHPIQCQMPGTFCDVGSVDPLTDCQKGYYCPTAAEMYVCPKRNYCRVSSVSPTPCSFFSYCPEGTAVPLQLWNGIFLATLLLTLLAIIRRGRGSIRFALKRCFRAVGLSHKDEIPAQHGPTPRVPPAIPEASFHITIRNLTLKKGSNTILNGLNLRLRGGLVMIQGTSGCGKSTLIKCLSGKTQNELAGLEGSITFSNGLEGPKNAEVAIHAFPQSPLNTRYQRQVWKNYQSHIGYVPQDDVVHEDLTVKDNIDFAIRLCRSDLNKRQQQNFLVELLDELQLTRPARNLITNISGGQRKRVNIGWSRCADPQFLILDEPTSGLDATTSLTLTQQLLKFCYPDAKLDEKGNVDLESGNHRGTSSKLVLMVIHQPRVEIFHAADQVVFMDRGRIIYSGAPKHVAPYFKSDPWLPEVAALYPVLESPIAAEADFCMDYINCFNVYERDGETNSGSTHMAERWIEYSNKVAELKPYAVTDDLPMRYDNWPRSLKIVGTKRPGGYIQFKALLLRHIKKFSHAFDAMCFDLALIVFTAFASGMINGSSWSMQDYPGMVLMSVVAMGALGSVVNVRLYGLDQHQTRRELQSGMHPVWYWLSVFLMDLGRLFTYPFVFFVIFYNLIVPSSHAVSMYVVYWCVYWACGGFGQFVSLLVSIQTAYLAAALLPLVVGGFLNGVTPPLQTLKDSPLLYLFGSMSFARWACERLCSMEFMTIPDYQAVIREVLFKRFGFNRDDGLECIGWLLVMGAIMRLASILILIGSTSHLRLRFRSMWLTCYACVIGPSFPKQSSPPVTKSRSFSPRKSGLSLTHPPQVEVTSYSESKSFQADHNDLSSGFLSPDDLDDTDAVSDVTNLNSKSGGSSNRCGKLGPFGVFILLLSLAFVSIVTFLLTY